MLKHFLLSLTAVSIFSTFASAQAISPEALQALNASAIESLNVPVPELPADKKWGISYDLTGALSIQGERVMLNTPDGRLFELDLSLRKARKFDGHSVKVEAKARQADDMSVLKVSGIEKYDPSAAQPS